jgi:hypothetical protein
MRTLNKRKLLWTLLVMCMGVLPVPQHTWPAGSLAETTAVTIEEETAFLDPTGQEIVLSPGVYDIHAEPPHLVVTTNKGQASFTITAGSVHHNEQLGRPVVLSIREGDNLYHIVLLFPSGTGLDAAGYTGEIRSRAPGQQPIVAPPLISSQLRYQQRAAFPVVQFVRPMYFEGLPIEESFRFGGDSVPLLLEMLHDPLEETHWGNIVVLLGIIGDPRAFDSLIGFLEQPVTGELSRAHYKAKTAVLPALGFLLNKQPTNQKALIYLQESLDPSSWGKRQLRWTLGPSQGGGSARDLKLTKMAIMGLGLSGHPNAMRALQSLQSGRVPGAMPYQKQIAPILGEAIKAHGLITQKGIRNYYKPEAALK